MHENWKRPLAVLGVSLALGFGTVGRSSAHDGQEHGSPLHGGKMATTKGYHFEVVFAKNGVTVFPRTHENKPVDASRLTGTATFYHPHSPNAWFELKLAPSASPGKAAASLGAAIDLSKVPVGGPKVTFKISGLPGAADPTATFTVPFEFAASGRIAVTNPTRADAKAIAAQKVCPVSKESLDSMGAPLKVSRGGDSIFICCKSCLKEIRATPDKFLGAYTAVPAAGTGR